MLKYLLLLCLCSPAFSQVLSLAEYNRALLTDLINKKVLSAKEVKALRIRLGTEMTSADDASYKEGELLKLLEYTSYMASYSKNKELDKITKAMWESYLKLPNTTNKTFESEYLTDIFSENLKNPDILLPVFESYLKYAVRDEDKKFFFSLVQDKCNTFTELRMTDELEKCWKQYFEYSEKTPKVRASLELEKITYYYSMFQLREKADVIAKEVLADDTLKGIHPATRRQRTAAHINVGNLKGLESELEKIKREDKDGSNYDRIYLKSLLIQNKLDKAVVFFKAITDKGMNGPQSLRYYKVAAELFFRIAEYQKADFYLSKMIEIDTNPLNQIEHYTTKAAVQALGKSYTNVTKLKPQFERLAKAVADSHVQDPEYLLSLKMGQIISNPPKVDLLELMKVFEEYKKYQYPNSLIYESVSKLIAFQTEKQKEPAKK